MESRAVERWLGLGKSRAKPGVEGGAGGTGGRAVARGQTSDWEG